MEGEIRISQMVEPLTKMEKSIAATARPLIWTPVYQVLTMPLNILGVRVPRIAMAPAETLKYVANRVEKGASAFDRGYIPPQGALSMEDILEYTPPPKPEKKERFRMPKKSGIRGRRVQELRMWTGLE